MLTDSFVIGIEITLRSAWTVDEVGAHEEVSGRMHKAQQSSSLVINLQRFLPPTGTTCTILTIVSDQQPDQRAKETIEQLLRSSYGSQIALIAWAVIPTG